MTKILAIAKDKTFFIKNSDNKQIGFPFQLNQFEAVLRKAEERLEKETDLDLKAYENHKAILNYEIKEIKENFYLKLANELLSNNQIIVLEEVGVNECDKDWLDFIDILKRENLNDTFKENTILFSPPKFPLDKLCSKCNRYQSKESDDSRDLFVCESHICKYVIKRDINRILNLKNMAQVLLDNRPLLFHGKMLIAPNYDDLKLYPEYTIGKLTFSPS